MEGKNKYVGHSIWEVNFSIPGLLGDKAKECHVATKSESILDAAARAASLKKRIAADYGVAVNDIKIASIDHLCTIDA